MADPLSITAGLLAIITATIQSSKAFYQTVQSFRNHPRAVRQLKDELQALDGVLWSLEALTRHKESLFVPLRLPLSQCCQACIEFESLILKCTKHSGGSRTSFRDWARVTYMDSDTIGFTTMLAGYKSTISIALADANLRSSTVTLQVLNEHKDLIRDTTQDLEDHLAELNAKVQFPVPPSSARCTGAATHMQRFQDERESTKKCLEICARVLAHIDGFRLQPVPSEDPPAGDISTGLSPRDLTHAHIMTLSTLKECSDKLNDTLSRLSAHREDANGRLQAGGALQQPHNIDESSESETQRLTGELDSARQCLAICSNASQRASSEGVHVLEDIHVGDDGQQMLISTLGELFNARRVTVGDRATQVVGIVSDASLQEYFRAQNRR